MAKSLFPMDLAELKWVEFEAEGFSQPVSGVIFRADKPTCCGVPLGGISTGCVDVDVRGVFGFNTLFNPAVKGQRGGNRWDTRKLPRIQPILGLAVGDETWVLASGQMIGGDEIPWCTEPGMAQVRGRENPQDSVVCPKIEGVRPAKQIQYFGHYPIADVEYETDAPVSVGLRAWSPFIPGDAVASNIPAAVFEVHLRNDSDGEQDGAIVLNFSGPDTQEARGTEFTRQYIVEDFEGIAVGSGGGADYILGVIGEEQVRFGAGFERSPAGWSEIANKLPRPPFREQGGTKIYQDGSCSAAVDFSLATGEEQVVRFLLAWYAPVWQGVTKSWSGVDDYDDEGRHRLHWVGSEWAGDVHYFTHMYAARYGSAVDVARRMAVEHEALLGRILAWQEVVYGEEALPVWLRDSLVNNLCLIPEDSYWGQARPPLGDSVFPGGGFAMNESPRGCPQISCIPCDWYGNLPIVFFFPELNRANLQLFKDYQKEDGEVPFAIGKGGELPDLAAPSYFWQVGLNGTCYVDMVDRLWQCTGDDEILEEFYESVKRCNTFTMDLRKGPGGPISMPEIGGMEWFEAGEWAGMASHMGGMRLAQLRMAERMAEAMGDEAYAERCREWLADGTRAMEEDMWAGSYYLNFWEKETGKKSDDVMGYQLDGEWTAQFHGTGGVFREDRVRVTLDTIRRLNVALTPEVGAANFARPDGSPLPGDDKVAEYGQYAMFPPELIVLAMTYMYAGEVEFGEDLARRHWASTVLRHRHTWDLPNIVRGDTGERVFGTDYYQNMMLWAMPAAFAGEDMAAYCAPGGFIDRVMQAGQA